MLAHTVDKGFGEYGQPYFQKVKIGSIIQQFIKDLMNLLGIAL